MEVVLILVILIQFVALGYFLKVVLEVLTSTEEALRDIVEMLAEDED